MRATLVYDGDCGFCTRSASLLDRWVRPDASIVAWQHADLDALGLTPEECQAAVQWVDDHGYVSSGHWAIAGVLGSGNPLWKVFALVLKLPGISELAGRLYGWVADHRMRLPGGTPACQLAPAQRPGGRPRRDQTVSG